MLGARGNNEGRKLQAGLIGLLRYRLVVREFDTVSSALLRAKQCVVCLADDGVGIHERASLGDADTCGDRYGIPMRAHRLDRDGATDSVGDSERLRNIAFRENNDELLPAVSSDGIIGAEHRRHSGSRFRQNRVTDGVPTRVVDAFEMIEIDHCDAEVFSGTVSTIHLNGESFHDRPAVHDAR